MEYRLGTIENRYPKDDPTVELTDVISLREYLAIQKALKEIYDFKANKQLIEMVILNGQDLHNFFEQSFTELLHKSVSWAAISEDDLEEVYLHANRLLLNFLSSVRTYLDHTESFLSRRYGKTSGQLKRFKKITAFNFDHNFCYRFFYKLRNYAQHCSIPIQEISFKSTYARKSGEIEGHLNAFFKPESLLADYKEWGPVKADLEKMTQPFELRELRESMTAIMYNLNVQFNRIAAPKTMKAANYLFNKIQHLCVGEKQVCVFEVKVNKDKNRITGIDNIPIPAHFIQILLANREKGVTLMDFKEFDTYDH